MTESPEQAVAVEAPSRLHLGFLDLNGSLGRRFGSVGVTLDGLSTRVSARRSDDWCARGAHSERALACLHALRDALGLEPGVAIEVEQAIPAHAGLGSGTQLALAVGACVGALYGIDLRPQQVAHLLDRGARSGIGIGAFEHGGFLVDAGRGSVGALPPIVSRIAFPAHWRVILILDREQQGLHGTAEAAAFGALEPFPEAAAAHLCRLLLMRALPALIEADLDHFGAAIGEMQRLVGDHFAPAQGGRYTSRHVARALAFFEQQGLGCLGQSSWGPTGFAVVDSEARALHFARAAQAHCGRSPLQFAVHRGRNRGAHLWRQRAAAALDSTTIR